MNLRPQMKRKHVRHNTIRIGLMQIKNLKQKSITSILKQRKRGEFTSLEDFLAQTGIDETEAEILIRCGACDGLGQSRPEMLWRCLLFYKNNGHAMLDQTHLPLSKQHHALCDEKYVFPEYTKLEKLSQELECLELTVSDHVLYLFGIILKNATVFSRRIRNLTAAKDIHTRLGKLVTIVGWLITYKKKRTAQGELMKFITLEDQTGLVEVTVFPKVYHRCGMVFQDQGPFIVKGIVEQKEGCFTVNALWVRSIKDHRHTGLETIQEYSWNGGVPKAY